MTSVQSKKQIITLKKIGGSTLTVKTCFFLSFLISILLMYFNIWVKLCEKLFSILVYLTFWTIKKQSKLATISRYFKYPIYFKYLLKYTEMHNLSWASGIKYTLVPLTFYIVLYLFGFPFKASVLMLKHIMKCIHYFRSKSTFIGVILGFSAVTVLWHWSYTVILGNVA